MWEHALTVAAAALPARRLFGYTPSYSSVGRSFHLRSPASAAVACAAPIAGLLRTLARVYQLFADS